MIIRACKGVKKSLILQPIRTKGSVQKNETSNIQTTLSQPTIGEYLTQALLYGKVEEYGTS